MADNMSIVTCHLAALNINSFWVRGGCCSRGIGQKGGEAGSYAAAMLYYRSLQKMCGMELDAKGGFCVPK